MPLTRKAKAMPKSNRDSRPFGDEGSVLSSTNPLIIATLTVKQLQAELSNANWTVGTTRKNGLVDRVQHLRMVQRQSKAEATNREASMKKVEEMKAKNAEEVEEKQIVDKKQKLEEKQIVDETQKLEEKQIVDEMLKQIVDYPTPTA